LTITETGFISETEISLKNAQLQTCLVEKSSFLEASSTCPAVQFVTYGRRGAARLSVTPQGVSLAPLWTLENEYKSCLCVTDHNLPSEWIRRMPLLCMQLCSFTASVEQNKAVDDMNRRGSFTWATVIRVCT